MLGEDPAGRERAETWLAAHPEVASVTLAVTDLNGIFRGKRAPAAQLAKVFTAGIRMPLSALGVDVWGVDVLTSGLVFESGDVDGVCWPTGRGPLASPWAERPAGFLPMWMAEDDGTPFAGDPRVVLGQVLERYRRAGLTPVVATELEFHLVDPAAPRPAPPRSPRTGRRVAEDHVLAVDQLETFAAFLDDVHRAAQALDVPAEAAISENGAGQFEINLGHVADALRAADDALQFKRIVKGVAKQHGLAATFMAKPYGARSGSGLHVHLSLLDADGRNVFDDGSEQGSAVLLSAVAGLLDAMPETMLLFAPHLNSFRRLRPGTFAPAAAAWGYENRTTAIRIPGGVPSARRIEHRLAGADANPYLVLAGVLGAAWLGIEQARVPPDPVHGNAYAQDLPPLPQDWASAVDIFAASTRAREIVGPTAQRLLVGCKRQEIETFAQRVSGFEARTYLDAV